MPDDVSTTWKVLIAIMVLWDLAWRGIALWRASHRNQSGWFIVLLVVNSVGMLPIIYLLSHPQQAPKTR